MAAAGNGDQLGRAINTDTSPFYPACYSTVTGAGYESIISVTALDSSGNKATWANYGATTVDIGAPGVSIYSTLPTDSYGSYSGTSMATPHVTGAIALYASTHPGATATDIRSAILGAAKATSSLSGKCVTGGRLDLSSVIAPLAPPTAPAAPTGLTATAGDAKVSLSWNASAGATSYKVYRSTVSGAYNSPPLTPSGYSQTSFVDTSAQNGTLYYYVVTASNSAGDSGISNQASATPLAPPPTPPAAPTNLKGTAVSTSQINLTWTDKATDENGFKVERSTDGVTFVEIASSLPANTTTYSSSGLTRNKNYYFRVRAYKSGSTSGYSNTVQVKTFNH